MSYAKNYLKMDKIDKLLDAIEHPERYTDAEIAAMLQDPETKEVRELLDKTKASLQHLQIPDVESEWKAFENKHRGAGSRNRFSIFRLMSRNVAASIAVVIASFAAVAAVVGVSVNYFSKQEASSPSQTVETVGAEMKVLSDTTAEGEEIIKTATPETIVFDNETLETIITKIAGYYGYQAKFTANAYKALRLYFKWDQALPIEDVIGSLNNFEQIHLSIEDKTIKVD